jgi:hypothetical protein
VLALRACVGSTRRRVGNEGEEELGNRGRQEWVCGRVSVRREGGDVRLELIGDDAGGVRPPQLCSAEPEQSCGTGWVGRRGWRPRTGSGVRAICRGEKGAFTRDCD